MTPQRDVPGEPVLILGLGRCGTSYLASFLRANGVDLGENLMQGGLHNPRGFFENLTIVNFHKRLLASDPLGAELPLLASPIAPALPPQAKEDAVRILESLARPGLWGWKDPRTILFIDFWLELLPKARLIIPIRHPLGIYTSYLKRIRISQLRSPSASFFPAYVRQSLRLLEVAKRHAPRVYVLDAQTAYRQPELLWKDLSAFLEIDQSVPSSYPVFYENEFTSLPLTERACDIFRKQFPGAAAAFQQLNEMASIRFEPMHGSSRLDPVLAAIGAACSMWRTIRNGLASIAP